MRVVRHAVALLAAHRRWQLVGIVGLGLLVSVMEMIAAVLVLVLLALVSGNQIDIHLPVVGPLGDLFPAVPDGSILPPALALSSFFLLRGGLLISQAYLQSRFASEVSLDIARRLVRSHVRAPYGYHLDRNTADIIRDVHASVDTVSRHVFIPLLAVVPEIAVTAGLLTVMLLAAPLATAAAAVAFGFAVVGVLRLVNPKLSELGRQYLSTYAQTLRIAQETFRGIREVKLHGVEDRMAGRYDRSRDLLGRVIYRQVTWQGVPRIAVETMVVLTVVLFLVAVRGAETLSPDALAVLALFAYASVRILPSVNRAVNSTSSIRFGAPALAMLRAALAESPGEDPPADESRLGLTEHLRLEQVGVRYQGDRPAALQGVDLTIRRGEFIGIVGPTGAGKTTLLDVLTGLLSPTTGRVLVDGLDVGTSPRRWQASIGFVSQTLFLLDDTLTRNVAFGLNDDEIDPAAIRRAGELSQLSQLVESLPEGWDTRVGELGVRLSGGQRQRVAIARALYRNPDVLIFDEGTAALDRATEEEVMAAIQRLRKDRTILAVAHRLSTVRTCDRIVLMEGGSVRSVGPYDELMLTSPLFRQLAG